MGERGIACIFIGYVEHSKASRYMGIELNDSIMANIVIESIEAIFDKNRFSSIPKPNNLIPTTIAPSNSQGHGDIVDVRRNKRIRKEKSFGSDFFFYLVKGSRESIENEIPYVYSIDSDHTYFKEAMESQDAHF